MSHKESKPTKKKAKAPKKGKKDGWLKEDVAVHTSLPPQVEGQLRCYLRLSVSQILWNIPNAPDVTHVRIQWWGETSQGSIFKPIDVKRNTKDAQTTARYPIRSGPKQFAAYLSDLGNLVFEVLSGSMQVPVGRAVVDTIGQLNPSRPINGFFPVLSADNEKIASLQVSLTLESLMASYDSTLSTVPTPDMSVDFYQQQPIHGPGLQGQTHHIHHPLTSASQPTPYQPMSLPSDDFFNSLQPSKMGPKVGHVGTNHVSALDARAFGGANPLRDSLYSQQSGGQASGSSVRQTDASHTSSRTTLPPYPSSSASYPQSSSIGVNSSVPVSGGANRPSVTSPKQSRGLPLPVSKLRGETWKVGLGDQPTSDSQGTLKGFRSLDTQGDSSAKSSREAGRQTQFANFGAAVPTSHAMVPGPAPTGPGAGDLVSVLLERGNKLRQAMVKSTLDLPTGQQPDLAATLGQIFSPLKPTGSTEQLYGDVVNNTGAFRHATGVLDSFTSDLDERTVDMVLGGPMNSLQYKIMKALGGSPASSLSLDDQNSDLGDPLHDQSILNELFYKNADDDSSDIEMEMYTEMTDPGNMSAHAQNGDLSRRGRSLQRGGKSKRNTSAASLESEGNIRPPSRGSRCSSMSSIILNLEEPSLDLKATPSKKKKGKKVRSRSASAERSKKGTKKGGTKRKSRCCSRNVGSQSDSELISAEVSRVSFDASSQNATGEKGHSRTKTADKIDGLSVQRLTLLGRVHVARVVVDKLALDDSQLNRSRDSTPRRGGKKRTTKPPRAANKTCTYFVEYNFPLVAASRDGPSAVATEIIRVASKNVKDSVVTFGHRTVFPILFDGDAIDKWWKSALVFKLYSRSPQQKVPKLLGTCSLSLKSVLKSESLYLDQGMEVKDRARSGSRDRSRDRSLNSSSLLDEACPLIGNLRVHVELASDSKDFSTALAKTRLAEMTHPLQIVPIATRPRPDREPPHKEPVTIPLTSTLEAPLNTAVLTQTEPRKLNMAELGHLPPPSPRSQRPHSAGSRTNRTAPVEQEYEALTLHTLVMIPGGQHIGESSGLANTRFAESQPARPPKTATTRDTRTRNLYLNCRMFWCEDAASSTVCWGTSQPQFNFAQVAPVLVSAALLERLRNNVLVVEVWDKKTTAERDQLVGLVKLPLHQFYMSFRDRKIANSLLKSQYPVVSVDGDVALMNPFNGQACGRLRVLLAMGSQEQVTNLQNVKTGVSGDQQAPERPATFLERADMMGGTMDERTLPRGSGIQEHIVEHLFELRVDSVRGLRLGDNMIWGEADCFIQYHFPSQGRLKQQGAPDLAHAAASLQAFRTATTLCVPDPVFNDVTRHRVSLPQGVPVQRELLSACSGAGGGTGGIPFEVWCRFYYPNVREQVIAKAQLPLARLCALVTMHRPGQPSRQTFTLQLHSVGSPQSTNTQPQIGDSELLEVCMTYTSRTLAAQTSVSTQNGGVPRHLAGSTCISVGVLRACGLQSAACALARHDSALEYAAQVGVNTYARMRLSFLPKEDERVTRTVARTFAPELNCFLEFPVPLLWTEAGSDALSLAEILETAQVCIELWHQTPQTQWEEKQTAYTGTDDVTACKVYDTNGDVMLGCVNVPLVDLLHKKTGLAGWFPVYSPTLGWEDPGNGEATDTLRNPDSSLFLEDSTLVAPSSQTCGLPRVVGGLELSAKFAHGEDLTRVIGAAKGVGWQPDFDTDPIEWDDVDDLTEAHYAVTVALDSACFPASSALPAGQSQLDVGARAYLRYKFYDTRARCSRLCSLSPVGSEDMVQVDVDYSKTIYIPASAPFAWYLSEERLEIQVWVTLQSDKSIQQQNQRPRSRDKLIGAAYIDLAALARKGTRMRKSHRISDIYPLFKPGASSLGGACVRAHITLKPVSSPDGDASGDSDLDGYSPETATVVRAAGSPNRRVSRADKERSFALHVTIERAFHLPIVTDDGESSAPNAYVSYQTAERKELNYTKVIPTTSNPVWNHEHDTRLPRDMLTPGAKGLVFKVWHQAGHATGSRPDRGADKVLGFVSVDLSPVTAGFSQLCGWYNVIDFAGTCQGQIKVAITPLEVLATTVLPPTQVIEGSSERFTQFLQTANSRIGTFGVNTSPGNTSVVASMPSVASQLASSQPAHYSEHYENVKRHHEQLNQHMTQTGVTDPSAASRSLLFTTLRTQIADLDKITDTLRQRLVTRPTTENTNTFVERQQEIANYKHHNSQTQPKTSHTENQHGGFKYQSNNQPPFSDEQMPTAGYERTENDSSTYSQTLRNAQGMLQGAGQIIASMQTAAQQIGSDRRATEAQQTQMNKANSDRYRPTANDESHHVVISHQSHAVQQVRFDERSPQMSDELPNYSNYKGFASSSNGTNTNTPHASSEPAFDDEAALYAQANAGEEEEVGSPAWLSGHEDWGNYGNVEEQQRSDNEEQVVMARPLNDVSSANFANYASLHENRSLYWGTQSHTHAHNASALLEEQDSWFSGAGDATGIGEVVEGGEGKESLGGTTRLYDTISDQEEGKEDSPENDDKEDEEEEQDAVNGMEERDQLSSTHSQRSEHIHRQEYNHKCQELQQVQRNHHHHHHHDESGTREGTNSTDKQSESADNTVETLDDLVARNRVGQQDEDNSQLDLDEYSQLGSEQEGEVQGHGTQETSEELAAHLAGEDPTALTKVSRTSHNTHHSQPQRAYPSGNNRYNYDSDSEEESKPSSSHTTTKDRDVSPRDGNSGEPISSASSARSEPMGQTNPMLMTQKIISIPWGKGKGQQGGRSQLAVAQGFDFEDDEEEEEKQEEERNSEQANSLRGSNTGSSQQSSARDTPRNYADDVTQFEPLSDNSDQEDDRQSTLKGSDFQGSIHDNLDNLQEAQSAQNSARSETVHSARYIGSIHSSRSHRSDAHSIRSHTSSRRSVGATQPPSPPTDTNNRRLDNRNGNNNGHVTPASSGNVSRELLLETSTEEGNTHAQMTASEAEGTQGVQGNNSGVPSFFPAAGDLASTAKALRLATNAARQNTEQLERERAEAKRRVLESLSAAARMPAPPGGATVSARARPPPTSQQADRIARIFQQKFT